MASKKGINKQGIIVITVAAIASILIIAFIFSNPVSENPNTDKVVLEENGDASYLNLSVPNSNQKEDSLSLIDKLDKIKTDSINKAKMNTSGLEELEKREVKNNYSSISQNSTKNNYTANKVSSNNSSSFKKNSSSSRGSASSNYKASSFDEPIENNDTKEDIASTNKKTTEKKESGFFKRKSKSSSSDDLERADVNIFACIHTNQTIMNNQRVKFRTTKEFYYNGQKYPINTIIYGLAQIKPNRLLIKINKINQTDIKLEVYDSEDSEQGLYVLTPNLNASLQKELKQEGIEDDDLRNIPFSRSLRNIFEKKVKEEKVQLLNNYKVLIKICKDE